MKARGQNCQRQWHYQIFTYFCFNQSDDERVVLFCNCYGNDNPCQYEGEPCIQSVLRLPPDRISATNLLSREESQEKLVKFVWLFGMLIEGKVLQSYVDYCQS